MERYDLRAEILRRLREGDHGLNTRANPAKFRCIRPGHDDKNPSAWIGDNAWGCHACDFTESLNTLADHFGIERPKRGFTLEDYADRKGFRVQLLREWGLATATGKYGDELVAIPYFAEDGATVLRTKFRHASGTFWGDGQGSFLYGLNKLAQHADKPAILCEGESDCHAAWHHRTLAIGVPGAKSWRSEWAKYLAGRDVYVWQEPDDSGAALVAKVAADLPHAKVIAADGVKDLADLHRHLGQGFAAALASRMAVAIPVGSTAPVVAFEALLGPTLERLRETKLQPVDAVPTVSTTWNHACRDAGGGVGLARGWHVTIGANTGSGKSLLALNLGGEALQHGERVAFISLEMSQAQLATRLLAIVSGVSVQELEQGQRFSVTSDRAAARAMDELHERTGGAVFTNRRQISKLEDVIASMRYVHEVHGCRFVIVDYMQLAHVKGAANLLDATQEVSGEIRRTARELNVVSVALSQFNRETSKERERPPSPQGLMGGSPIENDSDQVLLLDHSSYERNAELNLAYTRLLLAKNRHGPQAIIPVKWDYRTLRLTEYDDKNAANAPNAPSSRAHVPAVSPTPSRITASDLLELETVGAS